MMDEAESRMGQVKRRELRVLIVEDSEDDARLIARELHRGGYGLQSMRVHSAAAMRSALATKQWDLIITDHNMPSFDSSDALELVKQFDPNTPFILVSGSIGEEVAVDAMKSGAHDYVMKHNLTRLLPAVERELREAENRRARQVAEATIRHMAYHDSLTDLFNRAEFERLLESALASVRIRGEEHALLYLDLDQFKLINDSSGHLAGDTLLHRLAKRLQHGIRETDILARLGGDEFGVLLKNCHLERAQTIAQELLSSIRDYRFVWGERTYKVGASIGLVRVTGEQDVQTLLSMADMACYAAKDRGRNRIHMYTEDNNELSLRRGEMQWLQRLHAAMADGSLLLYRQRIQALQGQASHHELLLRMRDEEGGLITPDRFIGAAERYSLMPEVDRWVVRQTCELLANSQRTRPPSEDFGVFFVNLSGTSLSDSDLVHYVDEQLQRHAISPSSVGFEITETSAIADFDCAAELINGLRANGCKVALDDFGTGMSSFSYLKSLAVDCVKIDGGFVKNMLEDEIDCAIVEAVNTIGHITGIQTVAECVENDAIQSRLIELGVDFAQGWAVGRPQPFLG